MVIPEVEEQLKQLNIENVVLMGIEVPEKQLKGFVQKGCIFAFGQFPFFAGSS